VKLETLPPIVWEPALVDAAKKICKENGPTGRTSHIGLDGSKPRDRVNAKVIGNVAESFAFGERTGEGYITKMYVDDGVQSRGNRANLVDPRFKATGMAYCKHRDFGGMLVIVLAAGVNEPWSNQDIVSRRARPGNV
jgi:uncharacterized protein YkwD